MKPHSQRGVALVITLIMLAVVTLMAITFLAVSRRERSTVAVSEDQAAARRMADTALERAKAEVITHMLAQGSLLGCEQMVSRTFINTNGFYATLPLGTPNLTNVNYEHLAGSAVPVTDQQQRLRNIANLQIDPRPPVYVPVGTSLDFRFYLDLNRNGRFDTNGALPVLGVNGLPIAGLVAQQLGDPEWIGVLPYPDQPHSATNRFVGRYSFYILPAGKSLDLNYIHNNARLGWQDPALRTIGYFRNQGVGPWELNLAAFLHDLNTNIWPNYDYRGLNPAPVTGSSLDALGFLRYRYATNYNNLAAATNWFFNTNGAGRVVSVASVLGTDGIDEYTDGPAYTGTAPLTRDGDPFLRPWVGSDNPRTYFELGDLFDTNKVPVPFLGNLRLVQQGRSSYDSYTLYRLLGQLGTDSKPPSQTKINLNYDNQPPYNVTNLVAWTPQRFFTNVADRLIQASRTTNIVLGAGGVIYTNTYLGENLVRPGMSTSNIMIFPFNEYSPSLHRLLQVAVNLYDATTNRQLASLGYPYLPTVLRPRFVGVGTNVFISGYTNVEDAASFLASMTLYDLADLANPTVRQNLTKDPNAVVYNVPLLIGAKKGFPNFNEFALQNVAQMSRKVELRKASLGARPSQTNLIYLLTVSNQFGLEGWNSYTQDFSRSLHLYAAGDLFVAVSNTTPRSRLRFGTNHYQVMNLPLRKWTGGQFVVPIHTGVTVVTNEVYNPVAGRFQAAGTNITFIAGLGFYVPSFALYITNRFYYALVDDQANRIVDFVCLGDMGAVMDLTTQLAGQAQVASVAGGVTEPANVWGPSWMAVQNQVEISLGDIPVSGQQWRSFNDVSATGRDKDKSIDCLRVFCGLTPLVYRTPAQQAQLAGALKGALALQAGFSPTRKVFQEISWQANDPLVHYTLGDLYNPRDPSTAQNNVVQFAPLPQMALTNRNLGLLNERYNPWGGNTNKAADPFKLATDLRVKDPLIGRSDDWEFPTNRFPTIGWMGRVHRGTPWQTIYLKADIAPTNAWYAWAGNLGTHPTNDWNFVELFTTALNDNASRGLLSVNQTNLAAWSAVLNGVSILIPTNGSAGVSPILIGPYPAPPIATNLVPAILAGLNRTRMWETNLVLGGRGAPLFQRMGRILATPELTYGIFATNSLAPDGTSWARWLAFMPRDEVLERIPEQILSLLKEDEPRFVVYAFGQTLKEAPNSVYMGAGQFNKLCTNYQVKAEFATKAVIRIDGPLTNPRAVVESYNELTTP